jgi:hypothetical protein
LIIFNVKGEKKDLVKEMTDKADIKEDSISGE